MLTDGPHGLKLGFPVAKLCRGLKPRKLSELRLAMRGRKRQLQGSAHKKLQGWQRLL